MQFELHVTPSLALCINESLNKAEKLHVKLHLFMQCFK